MFLIERHTNEIAKFKKLIDIIKNGMIVKKYFNKIENLMWILLYIYTFISLLRAKMH